MPKVWRIQIHGEQSRLKQRRRQHRTDVERWLPTLRPCASFRSEDTCAEGGVCTHTTTPAITWARVRLVSPPSRLSAALRPRAAGLTALTGPRASPVLALT